MEQSFRNPVATVKTRRLGAAGTRNGIRMILNIKVDLDYDVDGPASLLLHVEAAAGREQKLIRTSMDVAQPTWFERVPAEEAIGDRIWLEVASRLVCDYSATVEIDRPAVDLAALDQVPVHELPGEVVKYLLGSRYIPTEKFQSVVTGDFGDLSGGARILAMRDWIEEHFSYVPGASDESTTAVDTFLERKGICRDYAHAMIALARASQIPARIASAYAPDVDPPDFHAVAEVWLGGVWHLVDATGMARPDEMAVIGVGRDAADISFMTVFGAARMNSQSVSVTRG